MKLPKLSKNKPKQIKPKMKKKEKKVVTKKGESPIKFKKIGIHRALLKKRIVSVVTVIGVILLISSFVFFQYTTFFQSLVIVSLLITGLPYIVSQYLRFRKGKQVEEYLPDFLRDVAESTRAGMTLTRAIQNATRGNYGILTKEMKVVASQLSWGVAFEDALQKFSNRVRSKLTKQAIMIIIESHKSGGRIADILETVSVDIRTLKRIESERKSKLKIYLISIYFIFLLFVGIIVTLTKTFIPAIPELNKAAGLLGGTPSELSEEDFKVYFFHLCLIQAFFAGLVGGQMGEGNLIAGFKHSFVMIVITLVVFQFFLSPEPLVDRISEVIIKIPMSSSDIGSAVVSYTVFETATTADIARLVREKAQARGVAGFDDFSAESLKFIELDCTPCHAGDIEVSRDMLTVNKPTKISYKVSGVRGEYKIFISGVD